MIEREIDLFCDWMSRCQEYAGEHGHSFAEKGLSAWTNVAIWAESSALETVVEA